MNSYKINAASREALADLLEDAQTGKPRRFIVNSFAGRVFDPARITDPEPVMRDAGEPYALLDAEGAPVVDTETDEPVMIQPRVADHWTCEVNVDEPDAELAALVAEV